MLPPHNMSVAKLSKQEGISEATLYNWRKEAKIKGVPMPRSQPTISDNWDNETKLSVVIETSVLTQHELSEYCRQKGLYPEQIDQWKQGFIQSVSLHGHSGVAMPVQLKTANKKIRELEKDLRRKDKALAEAAALLILQKKFNALWEDEAQ
jgi:transposase-like protein